MTCGVDGRWLVADGRVTWDTGRCPRFVNFGEVGSCLEQHD